MDVNKITGVEKIVSQNKTRPAGRVEETQSSDKVTLSEEAKEKANILRTMDIIRQAPDVRSEKVVELKKFIESGSYQNGEVIERIVQKMLEDLG